MSLKLLCKAIWEIVPLKICKDKLIQLQARNLIGLSTVFVFIVGGETDFLPSPKNKQLGRPWLRSYKVKIKR